jgi:hypothetical protein
LSAAEVGHLTVRAIQGKIAEGTAIKSIVPPRMTNHRAIYTDIFLQVLALALFFLSGRVADSSLPELGGTGQASSIYLWNSLADLAFLVLVGLWVVALWQVVRTSMASGYSLLPQGSGALAVSLPVLGLVAGYFLLAL